MRYVGHEVATHYKGALLLETGQAVIHRLHRLRRLRKHNRQSGLLAFLDVSVLNLRNLRNRWMKFAIRNPKSAIRNSIRGVPCLCLPVLLTGHLPRRASEPVLACVLPSAAADAVASRQAVLRVLPAVAAE